MITTPGIYDLTHDQYHNDPCPLPSCSRGWIVDALTQSPKHAARKHPRIGGQRDDESTAVASVGVVAHALLLGKGEERVRVSPHAEFRTNEAKAWRDEQLKAGHTIIKEEGFKEAERIVAAFRPGMDKFNAELGESFPTSGFEKTVCAQVNGVWCRILVDADGKSIWDLKTSGTEYNPAKWVKNQHFGGGGDIQAAFYSRVYEAATGIKKRFISAVIEQSDPYDCYPVLNTERSLAIANQKIDWALAVFKRGLESGEWDGYAKRVVYADTPAYAEMDWEETKLRADIARAA